MTEPWQWDTDAVRATVGAGRAGRSLAPPTWPYDAAAAVALSFDSDHETIPLPGTLSQLTGAAPQGIRTPSWDITPAELARYAAAEAGLARAQS